jgi:hypothetical protein
LTLSSPGRLTIKKDKRGATMSSRIIAFVVGGCLLVTIGSSVVGYRTGYNKGHHQGVQDGIKLYNEYLEGKWEPIESSERASSPRYLSPPPSSSSPPSSPYYDTSRSLMDRLDEENARLDTQRKLDETGRKLDGINSKLNEMTNQ